ncbi:MAG: hypothetical protein PUJ39_05515, partial [Eubacteriales bacterium]|nr:hypothetical protein [Eubacteriales bacterium]
LPNSIARDIASPAVKMGNRSLFPVVAVPLAFFGTFFRTERKYYPSQGGSPTVRAVVGASAPGWGLLPAKLTHIDACRGLSAHYLHPFGSPTQAKQHPHKAAPVLPHRSRCTIPSARR